MTQFTELLVENMFAYDGPSRIDLADCSPDRRIIVVSGQNGAGKTSLLNAVKLLFLGARDERLLRVGLGRTLLNPNQYVLGVAQRWFGVFNVNHRKAGSVARVGLAWQDGEDRYRVERSFRIEMEGASFTETLAFSINGTPLPPEDDPYSRLQQLLPRDLVPYFFFDGEQIQSLAEAEIGRESAEIERLLGLSFLGELITQIKAYVKDAGRLGLPESVRADMAKVEGQQKEADARVEAEARARVALEEEIEELAAERDQVDAERQRLRSGISESERVRMAARIKSLEEDRADLASEIAPLLPVEAPALTNRKLVARAFERIEAQLDAGAGAELAARLHHELPARTRAVLEALEPGVELSDDQARGLAEGLKEVLGELGVTRSGGDRALFNSISPRDIRALRDRFLVWNESGGNSAAAQADLLRRMRRISHELLQAQRDLDEAEITSDEARARYAELTERWHEINDAVIERNERKTLRAVEEQRWARVAADARDRFAQLEEEYAQRVAQNEAVQLGNRIVRALNAYHEARRRRIRADVERRLNEKVQVLLGPSQLIKSVQLSDRFVMTFFDEDLEPVARHSISAGMRQLVATAMLWALKEAAQRPLPVIIDTPLGRIDQQNRALLADEYYPNAGDPLILLPTNSEFGEEVFARIADRIRRGYRIRNVGGKSASLEPDARFGTD